MSDDPAFAPDANHFGGLASQYPPKLPRKLKLLLPLKSDIEGLLAKRASYEDIRTLLRAANIVVSKNTVYRFCREVIGRQPLRQVSADRKEIPLITPRPPPPVIEPASPAPANPPVSIQTALQERRERLPGVWGRRKRGPRIADSKNL